MIQVKIVKTKLVKPCIPTPESLKKHKLSFMDELVGGGKFGVLLIYASKPKETEMALMELEESLAKVLVEFYPLAGRLVKVGDVCVDCSDQGAQFVEAEAPVGADELIGERDLQNLEGLFPAYTTHQPDEPLLSVQITQLNRGGLAVAIYVSHKIFDGSSLGTFVAAWSNMTSNPDVKFNPIFDSASLFPPRNRNPNSQIAGETTESTCPVVKRFAFDKEAIARLRSKVGMASRVRVVSAAIATALMGGRSRPGFIVQPINMRGRTIPPLPEHLCGNLVMRSCAHIPDSEAAGLFEEVVGRMSEGIHKSISECGGMLSLKLQDGLQKLILPESVVDAVKASLAGEATFVWFSDWSKFGFYGVDFGWGKPVGATVAPTAIKHGLAGAVLMENKEGNGIEAWVCLDQQSMALFEQQYHQIIFLHTP